jgi:5'-3' exonuclease
MILLDNNQLVFASLFHVLKQDPEIHESLFRHIILNTYRMYRNKFSEQYGELVICNDGGKYWRKDIFPNYKANRSKTLKKSDVNWDDIYGMMDDIREEVINTFPYKNIKIKTVEADDIIAIICEKYHTQEDIVIVSSDKDFQQLQRYENVKQYSPIKKEFLFCENPEIFLIEHILGGDSSDGIPNILSDDDVFVDENKRQKPCGKKRISEMKEDIGKWSSHENWNRNQNLIDFNRIPDEIRNIILEEFENKPKVENRSNLFNYFIKQKLKNLMQHIEEF